MTGEVLDLGADTDGGVGDGDDGGGLDVLDDLDVLAELDILDEQQILGRRPSGEGGDGRADVDDRLEVVLKLDDDLDLVVDGDRGLLGDLAKLLIFEAVLSC